MKLVLIKTYLAQLKTIRNMYTMTIVFPILAGGIQQRMHRFLHIVLCVSHIKYYTHQHKKFSMSNHIQYFFLLYPMALCTAYETLPYPSLYFMDSYIYLVCSTEL